MKMRSGTAFLLVMVLVLAMCGCSAQGPYRVYVADEDGAPIPGLALQLCKDDSCMMAVTDAQGAAVFDAQPDTYKVAFVRLPEGYAADAGEFTFPQGSRELTIVLKKVQ